MDEPQKKQAWITALRLLAASPKSRLEISRKLAEKGYPREVVSETLSQLEGQNLLSDRAYAQNLAARLTHGKPSGTRKIAFELKRHGVSAKIREEILEEIKPDEEIRRARELAQGRWERLQNLPPEKRKKRVYDFLIRRGFDFQVVRDILEEFESNQ